MIDLVPLPEDDLPVNRVLGRYELSKVIGEGAYGRVIMAHDTQTDQVNTPSVPSASSERE